MEGTGTGTGIGGCVCNSPWARRMVFFSEMRVLRRIESSTADSPSTNMVAVSALLYALEALCRCVGGFYANSLPLEV